MKVFLTGGSSGIGLRFKEHLEAQGYDVYAPSRAELDLNNFNIKDVELKDSDLLILCAGVDLHGRQHFVNLKEEDFVTTINVNLLANMRLVHKYIRQRHFKKWSKIIVVGSNIIEYVWPDFVAYGTAKIALDTFLSSLDRELNDNIGITRINPGLTKTNFHANRGNWSAEEAEQLYQTRAHMNVDDLVDTFDLILKDQRHLIKTVTVSA